ncbi:MAG: response regulator, partial [Symploca sp. SIO3E6]|nr:response regulator [Caldora sp. SIO3E6]
ILGVFTARWITQPILKLNQAAKNLREGQWEQETEVDSSRQDELGELTQSFSTMATQLQAAFKTLEQRVAERTVELTESNRQLAVAKEKAEVANQAKSAFIANMSHELRSPLNAILGFSHLLTRAPELTPAHRDNIRIINQSGEHLLSLINNVLDLSKIEAGKTTLNPQNFDLWNLLDQTADMFRLQAESQGLRLLLEREQDVPRYLYTDLLKLRQVLINLLNNALKFTTEGTVTLRVTTKLSFVKGHLSFVNGQVKDQQPITNNKQQTTNNKQPITIQFEVEDTGSGIATEEQEQLFQAFNQTQTGKDTQEGTGLGLAISRQFVQLMGGEIKVNSQVGVGSSFIFDIQAPLGDTKKIAPNQPTRKIVALAPNQPRYKILVVDDKATNRQLLIKLLNPLGFLLQEATNGQEAIAIWQEWEPDLIFMDMRMPVMDGYEATTQIKSTTRGQATAVIAFTASVLEEHKAVVLDLGCDDFVPKPFHETNIFETINKHLGVRYLYEEDNRQIYHRPKAASTQQMPALLTPTNLAVLPKDLLHALEAAAIRSKMTQVNSLIEEVRALNTPLADALATLAHGFKYHIIANLIKQATQCNVK